MNTNKEARDNEEIPVKIFEELGRILVECSYVDLQFGRLIELLSLDKSLAEVVSRYAKMPMGLRKKTVLDLIDDLKKTQRGATLFGNLDLQKIDKFIKRRNEIIHSQYEYYANSTVRSRLKENLTDDPRFDQEYITPEGLRHFRKEISAVSIELTGLNILATINKEIMIEELINFVTSNNRICPKPKYWDEIWQSLPGKKELANGGWLPPPPMILAAWNRSSALEKRERLIGGVLAFYGFG